MDDANELETMHEPTDPVESTPPADAQDLPAEPPPSVASEAAPDPADAPPLTMAEAGPDEPNGTAGTPDPAVPEEAGETLPTAGELDGDSPAGTGSGDADGMTMGELLMEQGDFFAGAFQRGDVVDGVVVRKDKQQLILDIGAKQEAVVPADDLLRMPEGYLDTIDVGDRVKGIIMRPDGEVIVSIYRALTMTDWDDARAALDSGEIRELEIVGFNKGGTLVGFGNLQGFIPRSQLGDSHAGVHDEASARQLLGVRIPVKVIEVSRRKGRLIMSERQALREWRSTRKRELLETLKEGDVRRGRVSSVADFGAFVDLGGADGLVHVSEMTHERGKHPKDIVSIGQEVEVLVLAIDPDHSRIGLSMKRLRPDPWSKVEHDHYVGELVEVVISNLAKFGAFARLDDGLEGLIHISELSDDRVEHPREAIRAGQRMTVEIIAIDPRRQRIGLSVRRVPPHLRHLHDADADAAAPGSEPEFEPPEAPVVEPDAPDHPSGILAADASPSNGDGAPDAADESDAPGEPEMRDAPDGSDEPDESDAPDEAAGTE